MCGIVGAVAKRPVAELLIDGLKKLEYRGYDSAGIAMIDAEQQLKRLRVAGKVRELENALHAHPFQGHTGIAHTRWATHGAPSEKNAHPFTSHDEFALVHNGIIENHSLLREQLQRDGYHFSSETDTEVAVHLIHKNYLQTKDLLAAVRSAASQLKGAYALGIISKWYPGRLIAVRQGSPLVIGKGLGENFIASDPLALLSVTKQFIYLEDNDLADVTIDSIRIYNQEQQVVHRECHTLTISHDAVERGEYRHYMKKEIMEQPEAMASCLEGRVAEDHVLPAIFGPKAEKIFSHVEHVQLIACGTSYHAAMVTRYWIESLAHVPCSVEIASEFRYREIAKPKNSLFVTLSQSGETADTLAALRLAKKMDYLSTLAICNVPGSSMIREADLPFLTRAGIEIGVASTKAFVTQLTSLFLLALVLRRSGGGDAALEVELVRQLRHVPALVEEILQQDVTISNWAKTFMNKQHALFIGRGTLYPIALEGALKMKEISYIHAEGYPSGELKHGPLALVDNAIPVITMVPGDALLEKSLSNLQEVRARGGRLYVLTDQAQLFQQDVFSDAQIMNMPSIHPLLNPILYTVPLQLLAYHVAVLKGTDIDQPRNLAKSVTVE
ncbi:MAG: glutamine--fructose-6-phosphate transaminase (isomerizing) [Gammaproteobacteria bacterium]|nr:glutamine--fructose-6-phosphate transaminase (isomerizing) [Gammaproteobacteria bacterium]MCW5582730.1 glutamine--fructose-6-phosphate transaminase (isomerizing) [Gammaproteobacteria bacterium]